MKWLNRTANGLISSPVVWGGVASAALHAVLARSDKWIDPWLLRRLTGQWESYVCTTMFLMAVAFLVNRGIGLAFHALTLRRFSSGGQKDKDPSKVNPEVLLEAFETHAWAKKSSFYRRLSDAWQFHLRRDAPRALSLHLQELSDADYDRIHVRYGLLRLLIWTIPSCGSVATILAIAQVVEKLTPSDTSNVLTGLSETFNTFGFSVGLAILLFVLKSIFEQAEQLMLAAVDRQVAFTMSRYLDERADGADSQADQFRQLAETLDSVARSLAQQSDLARVVQASASNPSTMPAAGFSPKDMETVVQRAVVSALQRQPSAGLANQSASIDSAGWTSLQQLLQKLAHVLEQQNAKLETDGRVSKQLSAIIDEGLGEAQIRPGLKSGSNQGRDLAASLGR